MKPLGRTYLPFCATVEAHIARLPAREAEGVGLDPTTKTSVSREVFSCSKGLRRRAWWQTFTRLGAAATCVLMLAATGCASMGSMRWSSPAPAGKGRVGLTPEFRASKAFDRPWTYQPDLSVEYRRGVSETWDVGGRLHFAGLAVDGRYLAVTSKVVDVSLGIGARGGIPSEIRDAHSWTPYELAVEPALRVGVHVSRKSQVAVGVVPALLYARNVSDTGLSRRGFSFVPEATLAVDVGFSDRFHMVPQIGAATFVGTDSFTLSDDTVRLRAALGFYF